MINVLNEKIQKTGAPIVVGLDPMMKFVPEYIKEQAFKEHGETLEGAAEAIWQWIPWSVWVAINWLSATKPIFTAARGQRASPITLPSAGGIFYGC